MKLGLADHSARLVLTSRPSVCENGIKQRSATQHYRLYIIHSVWMTSMVNIWNHKLTTVDPLSIATSITGHTHLDTPWHVHALPGNSPQTSWVTWLQVISIIIGVVYITIQYLDWPNRHTVQCRVISGLNITDGTNHAVCDFPGPHNVAITEFCKSDSRARRWRHICNRMGEYYSIFTTQCWVCWQYYIYCYVSYM